MNKFLKYIFVFLTGVAWTACSFNNNKNVKYKNRKGLQFDFIDIDNVEVTDQFGNYLGNYPTNNPYPEIGQSIELIKHKNKSKVVYVGLGLKGGMFQDFNPIIKVVIQKLSPFGIITSAISGCYDLEKKKQEVKDLENKIYALADKINASGNETGIGLLDTYVSTHNMYLRKLEEISKNEQAKIDVIEALYNKALKNKSTAEIEKGLELCKNLRSPKQQNILNNSFQNLLKLINKNKDIDHDNLLIEEINKLGYFGVQINEKNAEDALESIKRAMQKTGLFYDNSLKKKIYSKLSKHLKKIEQIIENKKKNEIIKHDNALIKQINNLEIFGVAIGPNNIEKIKEKISQAKDIAYRIKNDKTKTGLLKNIHQLEEGLKEISKKIESNKKITLDNNIKKDINKLLNFGGSISNEQAKKVINNIKLAIQKAENLSNKNERDKIIKDLKNKLDNIASHFNIKDKYSSDDLKNINNDIKKLKDKYRSNALAHLMGDMSADANIKVLSENSQIKNKLIKLRRHRTRIRNSLGEEEEFSSDDEAPKSRQNIKDNIDTLNSLVEGIDTALVITQLKKNPYVKMVIEAAKYGSKAVASKAKTKLNSKNFKNNFPKEEKSFFPEEDFLGKSGRLSSKGGKIPAYSPPKRFTDKLPKKWISKSAKKNKGIKYVNPKNPDFDYIRFMNKNPSTNAPVGQSKPYFIRVKDGNKFLTKSGKWVLEGTVDQSEIHIPQSMFEKLLPHMDIK